MVMRVDVTHHIDTCEPDALGDYEYYYEYDIYRFSAGGNDSANAGSGATLIARSYGDTRHEVHFLSIELRGSPRRLADADLHTPLFRDAVAYLRNAGKHQLAWLSGNGYEPL